MVCIQTFLTGFFGLTGVAAGALGSHYLKGKVTEERRQAFLTASNYQVIHSAAMLGIIVLRRVIDHPKAVQTLNASFWMMAGGITLFSGSIYGLVFGGPRLLGPVTPLGGISFMGGWSTLMMLALRL